MCVRECIRPRARTHVCMCVRVRVCLCGPVRWIVRESLTASNVTLTLPIAVTLTLTLTLTLNPTQTLKLTLTTPSINSNRNLEPYQLTLNRVDETATPQATKH